MRQITLVSIIVLLFNSCSEEPTQIKPSYGTMTESVYASVTVQPEDMYHIYSAAAGILSKVFVKEGDLVKTDQILAQITTTNPKINIESAELNVKFSRENYLGQTAILTSIEDEIKAVKEQLSLDSLNYFRQRNLWDQNIGSKFELENKKLKYELTKNNLEILKKKYQQTELELENNYKQSQTALKKAQSTLSDYFISAKINGTVYSLLKNEGESINQQEPFAQVGKSDSFIIEMLIDEVDIARIDLAQQVLITLDAYVGQVFEAVITKIYPLKDTRTQTFKIEGKFNQAPPKLYAGLSGEANIVLSTKKNTMTIPLEYLINNNSVKTTKGETEIEIGMRNLGYIEIISGIDTGTVIIKP
ncbi:MAG: HlyD family secretion protein [Saprospiraceae bacterium]|jgi:HlyD family secretion protein